MNVRKSSIPITFVSIQGQLTVVMFAPRKPIAWVVMFGWTKVPPPGHDSMSHSWISTDEPVRCRSDEDKSRAELFVDCHFVSELPNPDTELDGGKDGSEW
jgi:hypothetical protein